MKNNLLTLPTKFLKQSKKRKEIKKEIWEYLLEGESPIDYLKENKMKIIGYRRNEEGKEK